MELKNFLKDARKRAGLSQGELAKILGYTTPQFVSNWERGKCSVPPKKIKAFIRATKLRSDQVEALAHWTVQNFKNDLLKHFPKVRDK